MALQNPIAFVRERKCEEPQNNKHDKGRSKACFNVNGDDIKEFYEELVNDTTNSGIRMDEDSKIKTKHSVNYSDESKHKQLCKERKILKQHQSSAEFLKYAQEGDTQALESCLEQKIDINSTDQFGWTALMCAAQACKTEAVELLLRAGADMMRVNTQGMDVFGLVKKLPTKVRKRLLNVFSEFLNKSDSLEAQDVQLPDGNTSFYCDVCKHTFSDISKEKHESSTIHLFESKLKPKETTYFLTESNKGFQMMLRSGWNSERGLGSEGQGQKYPVKTVLKRNRKGLGASEEKEKPKAKVTHFGPGDNRAVEKPKPSRSMRSSTISRKTRAKKERKEREFERNFRLQFK